MTIFTTKLTQSFYEQKNTTGNMPKIFVYTGFTLTKGTDFTQFLVRNKDN